MRILFIFTVMFLVSCLPIKNSIEKNHIKTDRLVSSLLDENGNAFYVKSSYTTFSTVWSYTNSQIEIYGLGSGKIQKEEAYTKARNFLNVIPKFNQIHSEFKKCGYELDGDIFGFKIKEGNSLTEEDFPISIECLKKGKYQSNFLNEIAQDITTYEMWEIKIVD